MITLGIATFFKEFVQFHGKGPHLGCYNAADAAIGLRDQTDKSRPLDRPPPLIFKPLPDNTRGRLFNKPQSQIADWDVELAGLFDANWGK